MDHLRWDTTSTYIILLFCPSLPPSSLSFSLLLLLFFFFFFFGHLFYSVYSKKIAEARLQELEQVRKERDQLKVQLLKEETAPVSESKVKSSSLFLTLVAETQTKAIEEKKQAAELKQSRDDLAKKEMAMNTLTAHHKVPCVFCFLSCF